MRQRAQNAIQHIIEPLSQVLAKKAHHKISVFLQGRIFLAVPAVRLCVPEMLSAVHVSKYGA